MQDTSQAEAAPPSSHGRKVRTKTFSGCWTCRAKHVKCDESRPTCKRCQRSGLTCEGYGVRLSWTSVRGPSNFRGGAPKKAGARPRAGAVPGPAGGSLDPRDDQPGEARARGLGGSADHSPGSTPHDTTGSSGISPNSAMEEDSVEGSERVFHSYKAQGHARSSQRLVQQADARSSAHDSNDSPCGIVTSCEPPTPITSNEMDTSYQDITWLPPRRSNSPPMNQDGQQADMANAEAPLRHLDALPNLGLQCQLMEHWTLHLCDALNPVPGIHNPLRTIMMPIALEGARADLKSSTGATALFHLISSASAFHLSQKRTSPEEKRTLESVALEHHNLGITHLGQNIQSDDLSQCVPVLASLVMCILNEAISTPAPYWRLHFRGAVEWVNHINPQVWHQTESASVIFQMFSGMATLVQSQLLLDGHESSRWDLPYNPASQPGPYILDMAFGLPQPIMQCLNSIKSIQKRSDRESSAESTAQSLDRIELELYLSSPKKPDAAYGKEYGDLVYHHGYTYYFAALVYMKRTIKDAPIEEVQALIEQSLHHIEILEMCTDRPFSPMLWPIAMIAFEISHAMPQNRMLKCLDGFAERSGLMLWTHLGRLLRDLWALRRTEGNANLKWHKSVLTSINDSFMLL
ncbi:fungal-specific transcription factor domain-containing protein [Dactylonectria estremocensis]|uniref:Fungal-specific transcription factor domain-containing protein n=1 Tax=Dactylonectria estremocensis TaxID=1079267 RepID=A0A9P9J475_9HYPO|nr:fungal-specific transcription factor domain-containing protein [Dactylonectria estremocensis]